MTSKPNFSLLVLAAGMGSRYGGLKQVDPVGPNGETLLDYSLYDAFRAGFSRVVFLIRKEMHEIFDQQIGSKYIGRMEVEYAYQEIDDLPQGASFSCPREKPWGTGHAVWCARKTLASSPFAVINADDFYGSATFTALIDSMHQIHSNVIEDIKIRGSIIGYRLEQTLSVHGTVSRGICKISDNRLCSVEEWSNISNSINGIEGTDSSGESNKLCGDEIVSMNVWAFPPTIFSALSDGIIDFFKTSSDLMKDEYYLPFAVDNLIASDRAVFQAQLANSKWMGVTYREDKSNVSQSIGQMIANGDYPSCLFKKNPE